MSLETVMRCGRHCPCPALRRKVGAMGDLKVGVMDALVQCFAWSYQGQEGGVLGVFQKCVSYQPSVTVFVLR